MPITYAGIPLTPPIQSDEMIRRYWHEHRIEEFEHPGYMYPSANSGNLPQGWVFPVQQPPRREAPRIGVLHWPSSASRWATCHLLATDSQLAQLRIIQQNAAIYSPTEAVTSQPLTLTDGKNTISAQMWMLAPRPIQQRLNGQNLYLITLVDDRWYWWTMGWVSQVLFEHITTWFSLYDQILDWIFGITPFPAGVATIDAPASEYQMPDQERWNISNGVAVPIILDGICRTIGQRFVRQLDGTINIQNFSTAYANDNSYWDQFQYQVLAGGRLSYQDIAYVLPGSVLVGFSDYNNNYLGGPYYNECLISGSSLNAMVYDGQNVSNNLLPTMYGSLLGNLGAPWEAQIFADKTNSAPAYFDGTSGQYADRAVIDYYQWASSITDCTMRGLQNRPLTGLDYAIEWVCLENEFLTRVIRTPFSDLNLYGSPGTGPIQTATVVTQVCATYSEGAGTSYTQQLQTIQFPPGTFLGAIQCNPASIGCCDKPTPILCLTDTLGNNIPLYLSTAYGYPGTVYSSYVPGAPPQLGVWTFVVADSGGGNNTLNFNGGGPGNPYGYCWCDCTDLTGSAFPGPYTAQFTNNNPGACPLPSGTVTIVGYTGSACQNPSPPPPPPPVLSWNCVDGVCEQISGSGGSFETLPLCVASGCATSPPPLTSWNCVAGNCVQVAGTQGTFQTRTLCLADGCGSGVIITPVGGGTSTGGSPISIPSVSASTGQLLVVSVNNVSLTATISVGATFGSNSLTLAVPAFSYGTNGKAYIYIYAIPSDATEDITISITGGSNVLQGSAILVSGLTNNAVDVPGSNSGTSGTPTASTSSASDTLYKFNIALIVQESTIEATSSLGWALPVESDGQDQSGNNTIYTTLQVGYDVTNASGVFTATAGGSTIYNWGELVVSFN